MLKKVFLKGCYFFVNAWYHLVLFVFLGSLKIFCQKVFFCQKFLQNKKNSHKKVKNCSKIKFAFKSGLLVIEISVLWECVFLFPPPSTWKKTHKNGRFFFTKQIFGREKYGFGKQKRPLFWEGWEELKKNFCHMAEIFILGKTSNLFLNHISVSQKSHKNMTLLDFEFFFSKNHMSNKNQNENNEQT